MWLPAALAFPIGFDSEGIPAGLQFAALPGQDSLILSLALAMEKLFGPLAPPPAVAGCSGCTAATRSIYPVAFNGTGQPNATATWSYFGLTFNGTCNSAFLTSYGQNGVECLLGCTRCYSALRGRDICLLAAQACLAPICLVAGGYELLHHACSRVVVCHLLANLRRHRFPLHSIDTMTSLVQVSLAWAPTIQPLHSAPLADLTAPRPRLLAQGYSGASCPVLSCTWASSSKDGPSACCTTLSMYNLINVPQHIKATPVSLTAPARLPRTYQV